MKNLDSVFAAYMVGWGVFFLYQLTVSRRVASLRDEIEQLRISLKREK
ncbi:MAG: hypothetical protein LAN71_15840 [Acidobacteriia bacterium]|nr:hypothetical protein [Terriglobia bacterium]